MEYATRSSRSARGRSVLEGIFAVLDSLERSIEGLGLTALASASGLPKATTHRMLEQLVALGAVERCGGRYRIGPRMFQLGQAWRPHQLLQDAGRHAVRHLAVMTKASAVLTVLYDGNALVVSAESAVVDCRVQVRPGMTFPLSTAAGRALAIGESRVAAAAASFPARWERVLTDVRRRGVAVEREEVMSHVACVAAPVYSPTGHQVVASISAVIDATRKFTPVVAAVEHSARVVTHEMARDRVTVR